MALLRTSPFCEGLDTTLAHASMHEKDRFAKQELGQVTQARERHILLFSEGVETCLLAVRHSTLT